MVHLTISLFFIAGLVAPCFSTPSRRTVAQVEADIASISSQVTTLDGSINSFSNPGGTLAEALAIHTSSQTLAGTLVTAVADVLATGPVSDSDARTILDSVEAFEPTILDALTVIIDKKPAFDALPIGGLPALVLQDLQQLGGNTTAFETALINAAPTDLVGEATSIRNTIDTAFANAIAAYTP